MQVFVILRNYEVNGVDIPELIAVTDTFEKAERIARGVGATEIREEEVL